MVADASTVAAKRSLDVLIELFRRKARAGDSVPLMMGRGRGGDDGYGSAAPPPPLPPLPLPLLLLLQVWTDARTVNVIATALTSLRTKLLVAALRFFLGIGDKHASAAAAAGG